MRRAFAVFAALALVAAGCRTPDVFSGWGAYVPTFGMGTAASSEEALPSPDETVNSEMPPVEGNWAAP